MSKHQPGTDDETFRRAIGWQSPDGPLPDDYEEQLLERLFSEGAPQLGDVRLQGLDELGPVSAAPISLVPASFARNGRRQAAREAVCPPPLVDTPPVSPKLSWRPSRRMTMVLAAAAAVTLVGVHQMPSSNHPDATTVAAPVPAPAPPDRPRPDDVTPLVPDEAPTHLSCEGRDPKQPCNDDGHPTPTEAPQLDGPAPMPDPGAHRLAQRGETPVEFRAPVEIVAPADGLPRGVPTRGGDTQLVAFGGAPAVTARPWGWGDCGMGDCSLATIGPASVAGGFDPNAGHAEVAAAILDDEMPLPAVAVNDGAPGPGVLPTRGVLPTPVRTPAVPNARSVAHLATHNIGPRWLGLDVSLPRDIENTPAGIRVVGAIDISKTHRQLQF